MAQDARTEPQVENCCPPVRQAAEGCDPALTEAARLFRALGDENRLSILRQLREQGEVCACDFRACCRLAQPTVSHHLKVLRRAGLVRAEKRGLWVYYSLNAEKLAELRRHLP